MMLRSLHIIGSRQMGGAESFFLRLVRALNDAGHPALAGVRPRSPLGDELGAGIEIHRIVLNNSWDLLSVAAIRRLVRETRVDVVQSYMGRASRLTRLPKNSPAVHVARLGGFYKIDGYYRHADAWVGNTRALCDYLVRQGLPGSRVFQIGNFVESPRSVSAEEAEALRREIGVPDDALVIFSLGRFIDIKGFDDLLNAFAELPAEVGGRPLFLVLGGDGPLRDALLKLAADLELGRRFHWAGWLKDTAPWFSIADLFVVPSTHETLGNVILEAWAHRLPVVSTMTPGALELVRDGMNGLLCPTGDPVQLATRCRELAGSCPERERLAAAGAAELELHHGREAVVNSYLSMYQQLIGARNR
jgi:glycosyltransferase involved in cell wall biosynthesis